jgi:hypothetical protein
MPTKLINASDVQYKVYNAICQSVSENVAANENKIADNRCSARLGGMHSGRGESLHDRMDS